MVEYLSPAQAAAKYPFGNAQWYRNQLRAGRLRGTRINGHWYTTADDIEAMAQSGSNDTQRRRRRRAS